MKSYKIHSPPFAGLPSFAKFPILTEGELSGKETSFGIIGIPYDMGTTDIPGARMAPRSIRAASTQYAYTSASDYYGLSASKRGFFDIEENRWLLKNMECYDLGDIEIIAGDPAGSFELITEHIKRLLTFGLVPISLGGDHAITYPILDAFEKQDITILHFDAHMDYWDPGRNSLFDHSCPIWRLSRKQNIKNIYQFGIRGLNHPPRMLEDAKNNKITTFTAKYIRENFKDISKQVNLARNVYVTFDIDFFDPSIAPGTGTREIGGFTYSEGANLLKSLLKDSGSQLIGLDLVEVNPLNDVSNITSLLAARLLLEMIGLNN